MKRIGLFIAGGLAGAAITSAWPAGAGPYRYTVCHLDGGRYVAHVTRDGVGLADAPQPPAPPDFQVSTYTWDDDPCPPVLGHAEP